MSTYSGDITLWFESSQDADAALGIFRSGTLAVLLDWPGAIADEVCTEDGPIKTQQMQIFYTAPELPRVATFTRLLSLQGLNSFNIWYTDSNMTTRGEFQWDLDVPDNGKACKAVVHWTRLSEDVRKKQLAAKGFSGLDEYELEELYQQHQQESGIDVPFPEGPSINNVVESLKRHRRKS